MNGESLKKARDLVGVSLDAVAQRAGVGASYLSKVESGAVTPRPGWVAKVSQTIASFASEMSDGQRAAADEAIGLVRASAA